MRNRTHIINALILVSLSLFAKEACAERTWEKSRQWPESAKYKDGEVVFSTTEILRNINFSYGVSPMAHGAPFSFSTNKYQIKYNSSKRSLCLYIDSRLAECGGDIRDDIFEEINSQFNFNVRTYRPYDSRIGQRPWGCL